MKQDLLAKRSTAARAGLPAMAEKTFSYIGEGFSDAKALNLSDAQAVFDIPAYAQKFLRKHKGKNNFYTNIMGNPDLVQALCMQAHAQNLAFREKENILVCAGAVNGFSALCHALCDEGDVILALSPAYILFSHAVRSYGAEMVLVPSERRNGKFMVSPDTLERKIRELKEKGKKIKALLIVNPSNIDGQYRTQEDIDVLAPVIRKHDLLVIEDRVYDRLQFDAPENGPEAPAFFANHPLLAQNCVTLDSVSKRYGATQWRIGWVYGPKTIIDAARPFVLQSIWSPARALQKASALMVLAALPKGMKASGSPNTSFNRFLRKARKCSAADQSYFYSLHAEYMRRRDLCLWIVNGNEAYREKICRHPGLTPLSELKRRYGRLVRKHGLQETGITGFATPVIPKAAMFMLLETKPDLFDRFASNQPDKDLLFARILYKNTGLVILPPAELTLPDGEQLFRMEYGVDLDILLKSLRQLQDFSKYWLSLDAHKASPLVDRAMIGMHWPQDSLTETNIKNVA